MGRDDAFYKELVEILKVYHTKSSGLGVLMRPDYLVDSFWKRAEEYANAGVKPAKRLYMDGFKKFQHFFKWAAGDHHVIEVINLIKTYGEVNAGKAIWKHAEDHHQV